MEIYWNMLYPTLPQLEQNDNRFKLACRILDIWIIDDLIDWKSCHRLLKVLKYTEPEIEELMEAANAEANKTDSYSYVKKLIRDDRDFIWLSLSYILPKKKYENIWVFSW